MTFIKRKGRATLSVGKRGPRMSYRLGCAVPILAMLMVAALLAGCGGGRTIEGTFSLTSEEVFTGSSCQGDGGYSDIAPGMNITLKNEAGEIISTTSAGEGTPMGRRCEFAFTFEDVQRAEFYTVESGSRGGLTYSAEEMEEREWTIDLTIGD